MYLVVLTIWSIVVLKRATADLVENLDGGRTFEVNVHSGDEIEALVMMMSMIMLRNFTMTGLCPKEVLAKVIDQICQNKEEMFVTAWIGILDLQSGVLTAANAGHEYAMLKHPDSSFELVKDPHGLVLGGMEGMQYKEYEMKLEPGSMLFVYTDGVPEATDQAEELFGTERTLDALNQADARTAKEILEAVDQAVSRFVGEAPQFDDLTMLCIAWSGRAKENEEGRHEEEEVE